MPCSDASPRSDEYSAAIGKMRNKLDKITRLLCEACYIIEHKGIQPSLELRQWWADHQEEDRIRNEQEQDEKRRRAIKKAALAKLTGEELKLLRQDNWK